MLYILFLFTISLDLFLYGTITQNQTSKSLLCMISKVSLPLSNGGHSSVSAIRRPIIFIKHDRNHAYPLGKHIT